MEIQTVRLSVGGLIATAFKAYLRGGVTIMKQVSVIRDQNGRVVATFEKPEPGEPRGELRPVLKPGQTVHDVEAEDDYLSNIMDFFKRHST
jgi:hypothetical protein